MQSVKGFLMTLQKYLLNLGHYCQERNLRKICYYANLTRNDIFMNNILTMTLKRAKSGTINALQKKKKSQQQTYKHF